MASFTAFLRGINVGGHRKIKMDDLKKMLHAMGFKNAATYIQSGNVVFDASTNDASSIAARIEKQIKTHFGHDVPVLIRSPKEIECILKSFPFQEQSNWKGYISFLAKKPTPQQIKDVESLSSNIEKFTFGNRKLYSLIDKKSDKKLLFSNSFIEKKLNIAATTQNLRTVQKTFDLASSA